MFDVFVRLSGFIHLTSRRVLLESSTRTTFRRSFLGLLGETTLTTLGSRHRSRLWPHMPHSFETNSRNRHFCKSLLGCARRYIVCPSSGRQGDPPTTLYDRERRPEMRPILKPRSVTERTPPSFRYYMCLHFADKYRKCSIYWYRLILSYHPNRSIGHDRHTSNSMDRWWG